MKGVRLRFGMRSMLILILIVTIVFGFLSHYERKRRRVSVAVIAICDKGVDTNHHGSDNVIVNFKHGNVTDKDLLDFVPAITSPARIPSFGRISEIKLYGSPVTDQGIAKFQALAPRCKVTK